MGLIKWQDMQGQGKATKGHATVATDKEKFQLDAKYSI